MALWFALISGCCFASRCFALPVGLVALIVVLGGGFWIG